MKQNECVLFEDGIHGWTDHASVGPMWLHAINVCRYIILQWMTIHTVQVRNSAGYVLYATVAQGGCAPVNCGWVIRCNRVGSYPI